MVFQTMINLVRTRGPDEFWRKRKIFKMTSVIHDFFLNQFFILTQINFFSISLEEDVIVIQLQLKLFIELWCMQQRAEN